MGLSSRRVVRITWALVAALAVAAAVDGVWLWRAQRWNAQIDAGAPGAGPDAPAELRFAQAHAQAASGATDAALSRYGALQDDTPLGRAARYNAANLLQRQAVVLRDGPHPGQALPLVELAKESYRQVLRHDPADWAARYNLERAQRLVPDPDGDEEPPAGPPRQAERAPTTMRGFSPGLP
jgi:mxaK protein